MLKSIQNIVVLWLWWCIGIILFGSFFFFVLFTKAAMAYNASFRADHTVNHELMRLGCVRVLDNFWGFFINVIIITCIVLNWFFGVNKLSNVDTSGTSVFLNKFDQFL